MRSNYEKFPYFDSTLGREACALGWDEIAARIDLSMQDCRVLCIEAYPGVLEADIEEALKHRLKISDVIRASEAYWSPRRLKEMFEGDLTEDPVFGRMSDASIEEFFNPELLELQRIRVRQAKSRVLVLGTGASFLAPNADRLVYADMARWELQSRQRKNLIGNLGLGNLEDSAGEKYKRSFFLDWRVADRIKLDILPRADFILDTNSPKYPKMIAGEDFRATLARAVCAPLRLVPFFDPGPWGGQWMKDMFDLPRDVPNYAWCFDCVPEENSLLLGFGELRFEVPAINIVFLQPEKLLGEAVYARFGLDFPIRFDLLDTMQGGNLSFQVHPLTDYIREHFGMTYTQDESYYLLDAKQDATVYLGLKKNIVPSLMETDLRSAAEERIFFPVEKYANKIPAKKHDHFLIPAGTPHCSGANCMVLEVSAKPYIFTFKLWDWERMGLAGSPRPVHLDHGLANIQWNRDTDWVEKELVNTISSLASGPGWSEERTGLHELEFIETRRHWFTGLVEHDTDGVFNVLNLVEGDEVVVESPEGSFDPFIVHYAETFIIPAHVGRYTVRPIATGRECGTLKAFVRV